jgi:hypothetical protein
VARRFTCPEQALAGEIELAVTYLLACNPDIPPSALLMPGPLGRREEFVRMLASMLVERAENGLSGMTIEDPGCAEVTGRVNRA